MIKGVYVCYQDYGYDGNSPPSSVFKNELDAKRWCKTNSYGEYVFLEVKTNFTVEVNGQ